MRSIREEEEEEEEEENITYTAQRLSYHLSRCWERGLAGPKNVPGICA